MKKFDLSRSTFALWPQTNDHSYEQCIQHDLKFWKGGRLVKDEDDLLQCKKVLIGWSRVIVQAFIHLSGKSVYPGVGWLDISQFCQEAKMIDTVRLPFASVDR